MNELTIDLNEYVSKQVQEQIESLEEQVTVANNNYYRANNKIKALEKKLQENESASFLTTKMQEGYAAVQETKKGPDVYFRSKQANRYDYIKNIMLTIFGIEQEYSGWQSSDSWGALAPHLAVNFYKNKKVLVELIKAIDPDHQKITDFISSFVMPYDYPKEKVMAYAKEPKYNTNGCIFGVSQYWIEAGAGLGNMPHDLIMKSPFIKDNDVFGQVIKTAQEGRAESHYLYAIKRYADISPEQLQMLGRTLISLHPTNYKKEDIKSFISKNLADFDTETIDHLYKLVQADNSYSMLHWSAFPVSYQYKFLKQKSFKEVMEIINKYDCKWTLEEKEIFLKEYLSA